MQLIRCTEKLRKEMGLKKSELAETVISSSRLGQWHANLIYIDRKKCVLFANDLTLFNFIVPDLKRAHIRELDKIFRQFLTTVVNSEPDLAGVAQKIVEEHATIEFASTNNRSVLGSMNDLAYQYTYLILERGGVHSPYVPEIIKSQNRLPMGALNHMHAIEAVKKVYKVTG